MDIYETLELSPIRSEPGVWVSRMMMLERIAPEPVVIRDVALAPGLNIIWAAEPEDDDPAARITGHSAGKTTFCRLLRYVLGEKTFGTKTASELIRKAFPDGYVAAEIHVRGRKWAVRRPFGSGRMSSIREDVSIEELLEQRGRSVTQESYCQELGLESLLDELETSVNIQTGEPILWSHILAWCARDQECRFQNIHDWRSPRSESETPSFRFPKAGPLFVMRAVLGLFLPDELKGEERLAELQREKDRLTKEIEDKGREPEFRVSLYNYQLCQFLKSLFPEESDIDSRSFRSGELFPDDLNRLTTRAQQNIERSIKTNERECLTLQDQIDDLGAELRSKERDLAQMGAFFDLCAYAGRELDAGLSEREEKRKKFNEYKDKLCTLGAVLFRDCSYIQERQRIPQITDLQDAHAMKQAEAWRAEGCKNIEVDKDLLQKAIAQIKEERQKALEMRDALMADIRDQRDSVGSLANTRDQLVMWMQRRDLTGGYEDLDLLRRKLDTAKNKISAAENQLNVLLRQHDDNRDLLATIFSGAVWTVLSSDEYDGGVKLENRELAFHITHGPAMSGEAVETLSVLLADVACLVHYTVSDKNRLPGFLIHDSPREADLGLRIYRSFIRFAASLEEHFGESNQCPFQYLITTTTAPPEELQTNGHVKLLLNAATTDGLLLRRNIALAIEQNLSLWE